MKSAARLFATVATFSIVGPVLGFFLFLGFQLATTRTRVAALSWSDAGYSIVELGLPCALAGLAFATTTFFGLGRLQLLRHAWARAVLAAVCMALVFGFPLLTGMVVRGYFSPLWALLASLAAVVGMVIGGAYPRQLLVARQCHGA